MEGKKIESKKRVRDKNVEERSIIEENVRGESTIEENVREMGV